MAKDKQPPKTKKYFRSTKDLKLLKEENHIVLEVQVK